jgi:translation elongation factor EF-1beta
MVRGKRAVILIKLIPEAIEVAHEKIEKEIFEELLEGLPIPWCDKLEEVRVTEDHG